MADKYLSIDSNGNKKEIAGTVSSTGVGMAGDIVALDANGLLDPSLMPTGFGADTVTVPASEDLAAGDFVNLHDVSGTVKARKADASGGVAKRAVGYVIANVTTGNNATIYLEGTNDQLSSLSLATEYFLSGSTPGAVTATPPSTAGYIVQALGISKSATALAVEIDEPIIRA